MPDNATFQANKPTLQHSYIRLKNCTIAIKRLDLIHSTISGNKFFKLKYNLQHAIENNLSPIISFGGAYSKHIYALAHACHELNLPNIGIIRGDELMYKPLNRTLQTASQLGMHLKFISRSDYRKKHNADFIDTLLAEYPTAHIIPEGGTNSLAIKGTEEILTEHDSQAYDLICLAVGTGGTIAGIINSSDQNQQILGFSALNTTYQQQDIKRWSDKDNWQLYADDVFGGYAKTTPELLDFVKKINHQYQLSLEPIYTGKAFFRLWKMIEAEEIVNKQILFIHTGGHKAETINQDYKLKL